MSVQIVKTEDVLWVSLLVISLWYTWRRLSTLRTRKPPEVRAVTIVVLGDIGRSPRMMYHAESFAHAGYETTLVGYRGTTPTPSLLSAPGIQFHYLATPPSLPRQLFVVTAPIKVLIQVLSLLRALLGGLYRPPEFILVQNPPSIPTLAVVQFAAWLRGSKVIIDWHNLGYSILALKLGQRHPVVRIAAKFEEFFGRKAFAHLFVTEAMKHYLVPKWNLSGHKVVFYDRPPARFHATSYTEQHELFLRLPEFVPSLGDFLPQSTMNPNSTIRTKLGNPSNLSGGFPSEYAPIALPRPDRPALALSSTSWTADEDFNILISALQSYERSAKSESRLPKLLVIVTGKGPLKHHYMDRILKLENDEAWNWVRCRSLWVEAADYPLLLGSADLGISLHASSSALDLPMKVVDMFGCGLPVCALNFACLHELVVDGRNGLVFDDANQLASQLKELFTDFPNQPQLQSLWSELRTPSCGVAHAPGRTWEENWTNLLLPLLETAQ